MFSELKIYLFAKVLPMTVQLQCLPLYILIITYGFLLIFQEIEEDKKWAEREGCAVSLKNASTFNDDDDSWPLRTDVRILS